MEMFILLFHTLHSLVVMHLFCITLTLVWTHSLIHIHMRVFLYYLRIAIMQFQSANNVRVLSSLFMRIFLAIC